MNRSVPITFLQFLLVGSVFSTGKSERIEAYDPLRIHEGRKAQTLDLTVDDPNRKRSIPLLVYLPRKAAPAPVVLFSHGLGGTRQGSE